MSATETLVLPRLGETMETGTLDAWHKKPGETFRRGDILAEVETDKMAVEIPALGDGELVEILVLEGQSVAVGAALATVRMAGPAGKKKAEPAGGGPAGDKKTAASPAARKLARQEGIDIGTVTGSGRGGRVQADDVRAVLMQASRTPVSPNALHVVQRGEGDGAPVLFLHGFGGDSASWLNLQTLLAPFRRTIALDLPGHGASLGQPAKDVQAMTGAVRDYLARSGIERVHFVGHSMGGAVAARLALDAPGLAASLTLIAPGGFGPEINHRLLSRYATLGEEGPLSLVFEQFFGPSNEPPGGMVAELVRQRRDPEVLRPLEPLLATLHQDGMQRLLPVAELASLDIPVRVIWGAADQVLPVSQARGLPGSVAVHILEGAGHMPHLEEPRLIRRLLQFNMAGE